MSDYINQRPIGANALWYAPVVGPGNARNVGGYLDHLPAPAEYSDLYNAYNTLDVLNDGTATRLVPALTELTGENHATATWLALTNTDRATRTLSDHARGAFNGTQTELPLASAMMSVCRRSREGDSGSDCSRSRIERSLVGGRWRCIRPRGRHRRALRLSLWWRAGYRWLRLARPRLAGRRGGCGRNLELHRGWSWQQQ